MCVGIRIDGKNHQHSPVDHQPWGLQHTLASNGEQWSGTSQAQSRKQWINQVQIELQ